jgi:glycerol uptake facilitator protein
MAEFLGTFIFLLCGIGCVAALVLNKSSYSQWDLSITWGMAVTMGVYICAAISGAHLNPSVTVALAIFGCFDKKKILPYIVAQMLAGFLAAAVAYFLYQNLFEVALSAAAALPGEEALKAKTSLVGVFCTFPNAKITIFQAFMCEVVITGILMSLIMALTDDGNGVPRGAMAPLLIGIVVALIGSSFGPLTGFAMNAARDFGPRLFAVVAGWGTPALTGYPLSEVNQSIPYFLVPLIAPIVGACLGAWAYTVVIGKKLVCPLP